MRCSWRRESEFFSDQYPKAHDTYGGLLKKYTNTRYLDTVAAREFALGRYWEQLQDAKPTVAASPNATDGSRPMFDTFGYAIQAYERVRLNDPTGPLADAAVMAMGNAYFRVRAVRGGRLQLRPAAQGVSQQQVPGVGPRAGAPGEDAGLPGHAVRPGPAERRQ